MLKRLDAAHSVRCAADASAARAKPVAEQEVEAHALSLQSKDAALLALRAEGDALSRKQARVAPRAPARELR